MKRNQVSEHGLWNQVPVETSEIVVWKTSLSNQVWISIGTSGYARPFDRMPVEKHTCMHPRKDVESYHASLLPFFLAYLRTAAQS